MRTQLNMENAAVISRNMIAYWLWHTFISINAVRLANSALDLAGASTVTTSEISNPLKIGVNYMTAIGLCYRMYLAISRTNNTRDGIAHAAFTYLYNQQYVGVLSNRRTLELMMLAGLAHNYYFYGQGSNADSPIKEFLFKVLLPAAVGHGLDAVNSVIPFRKLVVDRVKALSFAYNWCVWGGAGAPGTQSDTQKIGDNIHNPLPFAKQNK